MATISSLKKAQEFASRKEWDKAISEYEKLLEKDAAQNPSLYNLIGDLHAKKMDLDAAFRNYEKAIEIYCAETLYNNAIALCRKCLRVDEKRVEIHLRLGGLYASQGLVHEAVQFLARYADAKKATKEKRAVETTWKRILEIAPDNPALRVRCAESMAEIGRPDVAAREMAIGAELLRDIGDESGAARLEKRVEDLLESAGGVAPAPPDEPERDEAPAGTIGIDWNSVDLDRAAQPDPEAPSRGPDPSYEMSGLTHGSGIQGNGADDGGEEDADGDHDGDASRRAGGVSVRERAAQEDDIIDLEEVLDEFRSGVTQVIGDEDFQSQYDLGMSYKEMELFDDAITAFQAASRAEDLCQPAHEMIGQCLLEKGDFSASISHLTEALDGQQGGSGSLGMRYILGNAYLRQNDRIRARDCYQAIVAIDPGFRDAAVRLQHLIERTG